MLRQAKCLAGNETAETGVGFNLSKGTNGFHVHIVRGGTHRTPKGVQMKFLRNATALALSTAIFVMLTGCAPAKAPVTLKLNAGDTRSVALKSNLTTSTKAMGMEMSANEVENFEFLFTVNAVDAQGVADIKVKVVSFDSESSSSMEAMLPGGGAGIKDMVRDMCRSLRDKEFSIMLSPTGKVTGITGWAEVQKAAMAGIDTAAIDKLAPGMGKMALDKFASEDAMRSRIESMFSVYREEPTGKGDTWTAEVQESGDVPVKVNMKYTLKDRTAGVVSVESTGTMDFDAAGASAMGMPAGMKFDLGGEMKGLVAIDEETGWIIKDDADINFTGEVTIDMKDIPIQLPDGGKMPMTITGKRVVETFSS